MPSKSCILATLGLLASSAFASPIFERDSLSKPSLKFARNLNISGSTLADSDRARAAHFLKKGNAMQALPGHKMSSKRTASFDVINTAATYTADVQIGSPPTTYTLLIDTGSSNTWVGANANRTYQQTSSSHATGNKVSVTYGTGGFSGYECGYCIFSCRTCISNLYCTDLDTVTLSPGLTITNQSIGAADTASGFDEGIDGILGIGTIHLTDNTVDNTDSVPTVSDNLKSQNTISTEVIGISYNPTTDYPVTNGELTFGDVDTSKFTGPITYTPITTTKPAGYYWGIDQTVNYGNVPILPSTAGIVDTGTTLTLLASNAFIEYQTLTGGVMDDNTGLLKINNDQYEKLQDLNFVVGGTTFGLTPNAQIWPRSLNEAIGGDSDGIYLIVGDVRTRSAFCYVTRSSWSSSIDRTAIRPWAGLHQRLHFP